jgi:hypothetical protein
MLRAALSLYRKAAGAAGDAFNPDDRGDGDRGVRSPGPANAKSPAQGQPAGPARKPGMPAEDCSHYFRDEDGHIHILT